MTQRAVRLYRLRGSGAQSSSSAEHLPSQYIAMLREEQAAERPGFLDKELELQRMTWPEPGDVEGRSAKLALPLRALQLYSCHALQEPRATSPSPGRDHRVRD
jgi:hypothetical protein